MYEGSGQIVFHSSRHMAVEVGRREKKKKKAEACTAGEHVGRAWSQTGPHIRTTSLSWQSMKPLQELLTVEVVRGRRGRGGSAKQKQEVRNRGPRAERAASFKDSTSTTRFFSTDVLQ